MEAQHQIYTDDELNQSHVDVNSQQDQNVGQNDKGEKLSPLKFSEKVLDPNISAMTDNEVVIRHLTALLFAESGESRYETINAPRLPDTSDFSTITFMVWCKPSLYKILPWSTGPCSYIYKLCTD